MEKGQKVVVIMVMMHSTLEHFQVYHCQTVIFNSHIRKGLIILMFFHLLYEYECK